MQRKYRLTGMIICLIIIVIFGINYAINPFLELLSWVFGIAVGWAFRETLEKIKKGE